MSHSCGQYANFWFFRLFSGIKEPVRGRHRGHASTAGQELLCLIAKLASSSLQFANWNNASKDQLVDRNRDNHVLRDSIERRNELLQERDAILRSIDEFLDETAIKNAVRTSLVFLACRPTRNSCLISNSPF